MSETNIEETKKNTETTEQVVPQEAKPVEAVKVPAETEATTETTEVKTEVAIKTDKNPLENE